MPNVPAEGLSYAELQGKAGQGKARRDAARLGETRPGKARGLAGR